MMNQSKRKLIVPNTPNIGMDNTTMEKTVDDLIRERNKNKLPIPIP